MELGGEPVWVVGVPLGQGTGWVVALNSGRLEAFMLAGSGREVEPWIVAPDVLPPGAPPLVVSSGEKLRLIPPSEGSSPLTHPVPAGGRLLEVGEKGDLSLSPGDGPGVTALPAARVVRGEGGTLAVASAPTGAYERGVLGDETAAGSITLLDGGAEGPEVSNEILPAPGSVFETLIPLWFEDAAGRELLAVTESDEKLGSRISAYDAPDGTLALAGPPAGEPMKWRQLLAAGPFGPGGEVELAVTRTPHDGGVIEFYRPNLEEGTLETVATLPGYSTHNLYSRDLDAARAGDLDGDGAWEILVPDRFLTGLAAIRHAPQGAEEAWKLPIGGALNTNLASATDREGRLSVAVGRADGVLRIWP